MAAPKVNAKGKVYRVTNIEKSEKEFDWESKWKCTIKAYKLDHEYKKYQVRKCYYHPNLPGEDIAERLKKTNLNESSVKTKEIDVKCCFFNTTLVNDGLPPWTPYPVDGKIGTYYKRISVPFEVIFESYPICWFWCAAEGQVHYICGREEQQNDIEKAILYGYDDETNEIWRRDISTKKVNNYLKENKVKIIRNEPVEINEESKKELKVDIETKFGIKTIKIIYKDKTENILPKIQNNYVKDGDKIFYNIAVCGDVPFKIEDIDEVKKTK